MSDILLVIAVLLLVWIALTLVQIQHALSEMGRDLAQISADSNEQTERMRKLFKTTEQLIVVKKNHPFTKN